MAQGAATLPALSFEQGLPQLENPTRGAGNGIMETIRNYGYDVIMLVALQVAAPMFRIPPALGRNPQPLDGGDDIGRAIALFFVDFRFQPARRIDSAIPDALYGRGRGGGKNRPHTNFDPIMGHNNAFGKMPLNFVMATMFIALPLFREPAMGWARLSVGNLLQGLMGGMNGAKAAGGKAGDLGFGNAMKWASTPKRKTRECMREVLI